MALEKLDLCNLTRVFSDIPEKEYELKSELKTRKEIGQFFTPYTVAKYMISLLFENRQVQKYNKMLDPASGLCIFQRAYKNLFSTSLDFLNYEIDKFIIKEVDLLLPENKGKIKQSNYLIDVWQNEYYDYIISNPPYLKHINFKNKKEINFVFNNILSYNFPITTNYYCYFILKSLSELKQNGRAVFIVPNEFLNSNYGKYIKEYLLMEKSLKEIMVFDNNDAVFRDAISSSSILLFEKGNQSEIIFSKLSITDNEVKKELINKYSYNTLDPKSKWKNYFNKSGDKNINMSYFVPFSTYARAKRGIATGANEFFTFNNTKKQKSKIPNEYFIPCITSSNQIVSTRLLLEDLDVLENQGKNIWLLYLKNYKRGDNEAIETYVKWGEENDYHNKYLTKARTPWYSMENINTADILCGTFSRGIFKFIKNQARVSNLTCFHSIVLHQEYSEYIDFFTAYLNSEVAQKIWALSMREHGNGLLKLEPNDLNNSYLPDLKKFNKTDIDYAVDLYNDLDSKQNEINVFFNNHLMDFI
jgi:adenine-specific DNA-methyltransferase